MNKIVIGALLLALTMSAGILYVRQLPSIIWESTSRPAANLSTSICSKLCLEGTTKPPPFPLLSWNSSGTTGTPSEIHTIGSCWPSWSIPPKAMYNDIHAGPPPKREKRNLRDERTAGQANGVGDSQSLHDHLSAGRIGRHDRQYG